jgi:hypothetical protein
MPEVSRSSIGAATTPIGEVPPVAVTTSVEEQMEGCARDVHGEHGVTGHDYDVAGRGGAVEHSRGATNRGGIRGAIIQADRKWCRWNHRWTHLQRGRWKRTWPGHPRWS